MSGKTCVVCGRRFWMTWMVVAFGPDRSCCSWTCMRIELDRRLPADDPASRVAHTAHQETTR